MPHRFHPGRTTPRWSIRPVSTPRTRRWRTKSRPRKNRPPRRLDRTRRCWPTCPAGRHLPRKHRQTRPPTTVRADISCSPRTRKPRRPRTLRRKRHRHPHKRRTHPHRHKQHKDRSTTVKRPGCTPCPRPRLPLRRGVSRAHHARRRRDRWPVGSRRNRHRCRSVPRATPHRDRIMRHPRSPGRRAPLRVNRKDRAWAGHRRVRQEASVHRNLRSRTLGGSNPSSRSVGSRR